MKMFPFHEEDMPVEKVKVTSVGKTMLLILLLAAAGRSGGGGAEAVAHQL